MQYILDDHSVFKKKNLFKLKLEIPILLSVFLCSHGNFKTTPVPLPTLLHFLPLGDRGCCYLYVQTHTSIILKL